MALTPAERDLLYSGADPHTILSARVEQSQAELHTAVAELREVMSDQEVLDTFGIDLSQLNS